MVDCKCFMRVESSRTPPNIPVNHQEESEKWQWPKTPYKTNHFNCHWNSYYLWSQNAEFPTSSGHHFRYTFQPPAALRFPRSGRSGAHLRDQRQLPEARPCLEAIPGEEKEDHQKPSHQIGHQSREEPGGCWMLERDHDDQSLYIPFDGHGKIGKTWFSWTVEQWWNTSLGWWFQPSWKILVNGKDYPIYYGKQEMLETTNQ